MGVVRHVLGERARRLDDCRCTRAGGGSTPGSRTWRGARAAPAATAPDRPRSPCRARSRWRIERAAMPSRCRRASRSRAPTAGSTERVGAVANHAVAGPGGRRPTLRTSRARASRPRRFARWSRPFTACRPHAVLVADVVMAQCDDGFRCLRIDAPRALVVEVVAQIRADDGSPSRSARHCEKRFVCRRLASISAGPLWSPVPQSPASRIGTIGDAQTVGQHGRSARAAGKRKARCTSKYQSAVCKGKALRSNQVVWRVFRAA